MKTQYRSFLFCIAFLLATSLNLRAQADDLGIWSSLTLKKNWGPFTGDIRLEHRSEQKASSLDCWFIRPKVSYKLYDWLNVEGCYYFIQKATTSSHRSLLGFTASVKSGALKCSLTERWQYNHVIETGISSHALRSKISTAYQIEGTPLRPYATMELFTSRKWNESRHYLGVNIAINQSNSVDAFYEYRIKSGQSVQEHVVGIGYVLSL